MATVTAGELSKSAADVLDRVAAGESLVITRSGKGVAEIRPLHGRLDATTLLARWRRLPPVDADGLRLDVDAALSPSL